MVKYNLSELIRNAKDISLPRVVERLGTSRKYRKILRKVLKQTGREISTSLLAAYVLSQESEEPYEEAILLFAVFAALKKAAGDAKISVQQLLAAEAVYLDKAFIAGVKRVTKADITALIGEADTATLMNGIVKRNMSFVDDLTEQTRGLIERAVIDAQIQQKTKAELRRELNAILGKQAKRADLIADDQLEKLAAELGGFRAKQAGLHLYYWRSQGDDRVRQFHKELNGRLQDTRFEFHGDKGRLPRVPIRCRCWAQWVVTAFKGK